MFRHAFPHLFAVGLALAAAVSSAAAPPPGVVITHSPAVTEQYIGSPGIAILPDGTYLAKCERFGPGIADEKVGITSVFASRDQGRSWSSLSEVPGMYWATIFVHRSAVYLFGTDREYGRVVLSRSTDGGRTWSRPGNSRTGLLRADGKFHCAPVPVVIHRGRIWRAMEDARGPGGWGSHFRAFMMSAPIDADLLNAASWTSSNPLARDPKWNRGDFGGWLEGNAVVTPDGNIVDILRVAVGKSGEKAAIVSITADGKTASFDPSTGLVDYPGGA
ncbi:MAG: sialidase family protein, partial [Armatimonadota bacterium]